VQKLGTIPVRGRPRRGEGSRGHHLGVTAVRAELSSISSTLDDLTRRVSALAERARDPDEAGEGGSTGADLATELFAVERSLRGALRRLERAAGTGRQE